MAKFELATKSDLPRIIEIYNQAIPSRIATADTEPVTVENRKAWFDEFNQQHYPIWIIKNENEQIMGWVSLEAFYGRPAYYRTAEISIYFATDFQHQGLGQQTLTFVESQLAKLEITTVVAFIFTHNIPSRKLFLRNNFQKWGHLPEIAEMDGKLYSLDILGKKY